MWNLKKKWKDINACCFSTIPVKVCAKLKFWILKIALALKISKISSGKLCWAEQKKKINISDFCWDEKIRYLRNNFRSILINIWKDELFNIDTDIIDIRLYKSSNNSLRNKLVVFALH